MTDVRTSPRRAAHWWVTWGLACCTVCGFWTNRAGAQAQVRNPNEPIPVVTTGGHTAPVRSLIFAARDGAQLLSAGQDKIVHIWDLGNARLGPARTIRPRIWRGYAGAIFAMALAPVADANGQRTLAVAGFGVDSNRGEIGLFRFPGSNNLPTGDVDAALPSGQPRGHTNVVSCLAFDPRGAFLASGSHDATVRIWDMRTRTTVSVLQGGHTGAVNALAYTPDGRRLVTGGADGQVRLWDIPRGAVLATAPLNPQQQRDDPVGIAINALAVSPDGRWVVIGRENGALVRYDAATLQNALPLPRGEAGRGAVEALAISPDGKWLVTSIVSHALVRPADRPRVECDVELRTMPDGAIRARLARTSNLVYACAFSPDSRRVAFAGGDAQAITVKDTADPNREGIELAGQGSSIWDVGFGADSRVIGFARGRPDLPDPPSQYEDFDLQGQRVVPFDRAELHRALTTLNGWTVRPIDLYTLDVLNAQGQGFRLRLDPVLDRRWWSYSFLPTVASHPRPTVAIGCESGVAIYRLDDGQRTRLLAGHHGPVYALAPSPDGKWLVTGSSDQTVRYWRLAGCDTLAPLGAEFGPSERGRGKVVSVARHGFAEAMGMEVGDVVEKFYIGKDEKNDLKDLAPVPPNTYIQFVVLREGKSLLMGTTKRDAPALTLFPARDREWILWTPHGYYETSPLGDRKYLGWHRNRINLERLNDVFPTDFFAFDNFEKELRRPDALIRLLETADLDVLPLAAAPAPPGAPAPPVQAAARAPEQVVAENPLPEVQIVAPVRPAFDPLVVAGADLPVRIRAATEGAGVGRGLIRALRVLVDSGTASEVVLRPPVADLDRQVTLNLNPGRHRVNVIAVNDLDKERTRSFDVIVREPPQPAPVPAPLVVPQPPQLVVLAIGVDTFKNHDPNLPRIPFALEDARDVAAFLGAPGGVPRFSSDAIQDETILGAEATTARILEALERLDARRRKGELGQGDSVFLMIDSHFVSFDPKQEGVILGTDAAIGDPPIPSVPAARIADTLGQLADYGCSVLLLIDAHHERRPLPKQTNRSLNEWARVLYRRNVIAFVASIHGPSQTVATRGHGAFAQGILDVLNVQGRARLSLPVQATAPDRPESSLTLFEFQDRVAQNVLAWTNRQQHARCYIPETIPSQRPVFDPPPRKPLKILRAAND